jgi:E2F/DP family winged-helix DNA-binding domain
MGFYDEQAVLPRGDNYSHSPLTSRYRQIERRDSLPQSPFKTVKSPLPQYNHRFPDDHFGLEDEEPNAINAHLRNIFDRDDSFTVGQMFGTTEPAYPNRQRDQLGMDHAMWRDEASDTPYFRQNTILPHIAVAQPIVPGLYEDQGFNSNGCMRLCYKAFNRAKEDEGGNRCSRGLKVLSVKVLDIVYQKQQTSYKEVAEALINDGSFEASLTVGTVKNKLTQNKKKKAREEQNVKRRVYDALNVLIAAEVLRKHNKVVFFNEQGRSVLT